MNMIWPARAMCGPTKGKVVEDITVKESTMESAPMKAANIAVTRAVVGCRKRRICARRAQVEIDVHIQVQVKMSLPRIAPLLFAWSKPLALALRLVT
jgi:hypothetical protein